MVAWCYSHLGVTGLGLETRVWMGKLDTVLEMSGEEMQTMEMFGSGVAWKEGRVGNIESKLQEKRAERKAAPT